MRLADIIFALLKRARRIAVLVALVGTIPLLITGCFRSFVVIDHIDIKRQTTNAAWQLRLGSGEGNLFLYWTHNDFQVSFQGRHAPKNYFGSQPDFEIWQDHGPFDARDSIHIFDWATGTGRIPGYRSLRLEIGYPTLILLAGAILFWRVRILRRRRRAALIANGLCLHCGYDLRASPNRCPECGKPVAVRPVAPRAASEPNPMRS